MGFPKVEQWGDDVLNAGTRGAFNVLVHLEKELQRCYPDLKAYVINLCSEEDLKDNTMMGWMHMDGGHFDAKSVDDFNKKVGLKFGMVLDSHDHIKIGSNYVMLMPKSYRDKVNKARKEAYNLQNERVNNVAAYAHPEDPNFTEMKQGAQELAGEKNAKYKVQVKGEPDHDDVDPAADGLLD